MSKQAAKEQLTIRTSDILRHLDAASRPDSLMAERFDVLRDEARQALQGHVFSAEITGMRTPLNRVICEPFGDSLVESGIITKERWDDPEIVALRQAVGLQIELEIRLVQREGFRDYLRYLRSQEGVIVNSKSRELKNAEVVTGVMNDIIKKYELMGIPRDFVKTVVTRFLSEQLKAAFGIEMRVRFAQARYSDLPGKHDRLPPVTRGSKWNRRQKSPALMENGEVPEHIRNLVGSYVSVKLNDAARAIFRGVVPEDSVRCMVATHDGVFRLVPMDSKVRAVTHVLNAELAAKLEITKA